MTTTPHTTKSSQARRKQAVSMTKHYLAVALASGEIADMEKALDFMNDQSASIPFDWKLSLITTIQRARALEETSAA